MTEATATATPSGKTIHIKMASLDAMFDNRDPAPFPRRKLDADWMDYVLNALERGGAGPVHLALEGAPAVVNAADPATLVADIHEQLKGHEQMLGRRLAENFRMGRRYLATALVVLAVFATLSGLSAQIFDGFLARILSEGFLIVGWVALWKPAEILLYDWLPIVEERRKIKRLLEGRVTISLR